MRSQTIIGRCGSTGLKPAVCLVLFETLIALFLPVFHLSTSVNAQEKAPLKLIATTPLPGFSGDFDHFAVGRVALVDGKSYEILDTIKLPPGVDGAIFNPLTKDYYVESGGGTGAATHLLNIIDAKNFKHVGDVTLPGNHSEAMAVDRAGKKLYVNLTGTNEVGVVDLATRQLISRWPVPNAKVENSMVLDEPNHRLFIATRQPPTFFVFDTDTGKVVTSLPCAPFNDDMWFDRPRKRIYATGSETTTVIQQGDADHYEHVAEVPTGYRAKTSILVPELNRLYVAVSGKGKPDAKLALQIFQIQP